ncbi:MAG: ABC transporter permease [bacterium]
MSIGMIPLNKTRWHLFFTLTTVDFKLRDQGTALGFMWSLLYPGLMFTILYLLFTKWMGKFVDGYAAYLIIGLLQWQFFERATTASLNCLRRSSQLVRNFRFPIELLVMSSVGSAAICYAIELCIMFIFVIVLGISPSLRWLTVPAIAAASAVFCVGVSLWLSTLTLEYQDMERIWTILLTAGFFLTPVFYPIHILSARNQALINMNPMLHFIGALRSATTGQSPFPLSGFLTVSAAGVILCASGLWFFARHHNRLIDRIILK